MNKVWLTESEACWLDVLFLPNWCIFDRDVPIPAHYHQKNVHKSRFLHPIFRFVVGWQPLEAEAIVIAAKEGMRREKSLYGDGRWGWASTRLLALCQAQVCKLTKVMWCRYEDFAEVVLLIRSNLCSRSLLREIGLCLHGMLMVKTNPTMSSTDNKQT